MKTINLLLLSGLMLLAMNSAQAVTAKDNFNWYCAQCHDQKGTGNGINSVDELPVGPMDLTNPKEMEKYPAARIVKTLTHGGPVNNLDSLMPPWGNRLSKDEIAALVKYVQSLCVQEGCNRE